METSSPRASATACRGVQVETGGDVAGTDRRDEGEADRRYKTGTDRRDEAGFDCSTVGAEATRRSRSRHHGTEGK